MNLGVMESLQTMMKMTMRQVEMNLQMKVNVQVMKVPMRKTAGQPMMTPVMVRKKHRPRPLTSQVKMKSSRTTS